MSYGAVQICSKPFKTTLHTHTPMGTRVSDKKWNSQCGCSLQFVSKSSHRFFSYNLVWSGQIDEIRIVGCHDHLFVLLPLQRKIFNHFRSKRRSLPLPLVAEKNLQGFTFNLSDSSESQMQAAGDGHMGSQ